MPTPTSIVVISGDNQAAQISTTFAAPIVALLRDEFNNPMPGVQLSFIPPGVGPTGTFAGGNPNVVTTNGSGQATSAALTANGTVGAWSAPVIVFGMASVNSSFSMTNTATPPVPVPTTLSITANGTQKAAQNTAYLPVSAKIVDQFGAPLAGVSISMTCSAGRGTFPGGGVTNFKTSNASGMVTFAVFTASSTLGTFAPAIQTTGVPTVTGSFKTINPLVVTSISAYSGSGQSAAPSFAFAAPLVGRAANEINGPVAGKVLTFDAPNSGASLVWDSPATDPATAITDVNGLATSPGMTANATAGSYNVTLSYTGVASRNFGLTNGGSPPASDSSLNQCEV